MEETLPAADPLLRQRNFAAESLVFAPMTGAPRGVILGTVTHALPADVIAQIKAMDPAITPGQAQAVWALLTPFHEKLGCTAPRIDRDLTYGDHPRHRLDVHTGDQPRAAAPVVLFVHGGGFTGGDKHVPGTPRYDLVGAWAVRRGWVGVTMTYRLAPGYQWPAGAEDVAAAVAAWLASHGTVPDLVWVEGHNHMSAVGSLGIDEAALGTPLARFIERSTGTEGSSA